MWNASRSPLGIISLPLNKRAVLSGRPTFRPASRRQVREYAGEYGDETNPSDNDIRLRSILEIFDAALLSEQMERNDYFGSSSIV